MHDATEDVPGDGVGAVRCAAELVVVLPHLLRAQLRPRHQQLQVRGGQRRRRGHRTRLPPHSAQVQFCGLVTHNLGSEIFSQH